MGTELDLQGVIVGLPGWELMEAPIRVPLGETWAICGWLICDDGKIRLIVKTPCDDGYSEGLRGEK